jgi:uncharacterized protein YoaH (UPF0181 family)
MSRAEIVTTLVKSTPNLARMSMNLGWVYLTLGRRVSRTRKAFEEQLTAQGMSTEDAIRLSACYEELKDNITSMIKQSIRFGVS